MARMRTISWIMLVIVGALTFVASLGSAYISYRSPDSDVIGGQTKLADVAAGRADVATALRARRGTAAAFAAAYAVLFLFIVLVPYRRGDVWSWWALLAGMLVLVVLTLARIPFLHTRLGAGAAWLQLGIVGVALLLDVKRVSSPATT
jgi:hypothetical protein